jgi:Flagellar hook-length control protein FliK
MDIQPAILATQLLAKPTQLNLSQTLLGQILNATVVSKKSADTFILQIGNQQVEAKADQNRPLNVGDQLKLSVEKQDNPVVLRVLQQRSSPKEILEVKQQLLRESVPKQAGMEKLTTVLNQVSSNVKEAIKALPLPIEQQFKKLIEHLPAKNNLNNETGLKTAIKNSGIFLEAKLLTEASNKKPELLLKTPGQTTKQSSAQAPGQTSVQTQPQAITKDLKTNLLQLAHVISKYKQSTQTQENLFAKSAQITPESAPAKEASANTKNTNRVVDLALKADVETIGKQVESSIARIEVNQSKAVVTHDNQAPFWSIEMPVKDKQDIDLLKLNIHADKDSNSDSNEVQVWSTSLTINFENIGSISAKLSIIDKEVNATLWSESETLNDLINNNLSVLNKQIEKCGLSTGKIICLDEAPVEKEIPHTSKNLINITI